MSPVSTDNQVHGATLLPFWFTITQADHYAITFMGGSISKRTPGGSGFLRPTVDGHHDFIFSFYPDRDAWEIDADGARLKNFTYPASAQVGTNHPQTISPVDIIVDKGARVTLSYFSIAIAT